MGALEAPQDKHGQEHRTGTSRAEQTDRDHGGAGSSGSHGGAGSSGGHGRAGSSGGHGVARGSGGHGSAGSSGAMAGGPCGHGLGPLGPAPTAGTLLPPQKKLTGEVRGYQEPSGARHRQTGQDIPQEPLPPPRQGGRRLEWPP